jgi:hypothetical protein
MPGLVVIPPAVAAVETVFSMDQIDNPLHPNHRLIYMTRGGVQTPLGYFNIRDLLLADMQGRSFCDIVKDSQAETKVNNIIAILQRCFGNVTGIPANIAAYKTELHRYDEAVTTALQRFITVYKNILKTSTVGNNLQISDAKYAFSESGMACKTVCRDPAMKTVKSSAATLDSLLKSAYDLLFNPFLKFDVSFTRGLGIPGGLQWSSRPTTDARKSSLVTIQFETPPPGVAAAAANTISGEVDNEANSALARGLFNGVHPGNGDVMGNDLKNIKVNQLSRNLPQNCPKIKKLFIVKEIGDVIQVWMYLAFILMMGYDPSEVIMVTTDSVVYLFCMLLNLSCIYTGERAGVQSGCCTLKHYLGGQPDYLQKYNNMIQVHAERLKQHNSSIKKALALMVFNPSMFDYYIVYGGGVRRTIASKGLTSQIQTNSVNPMIRGFMSIIDETNKCIDIALKLVQTRIALVVATRKRDIAEAAARAAVGGAVADAQRKLADAQRKLADAQHEAAAAEIAAAAATRAAIPDVGGILPEETRFTGQAAVDTAALLQTAMLELGTVRTNAEAVVRTAAAAAAPAAAPVTVTAAETAITAGYTHFCRVFDTLKQSNTVTLLPTKRYVILPGPFLTMFSSHVNPPDVVLVANVDSIIAGVEAAAAAAAAEAGAMRGGGGRNVSNHRGGHKRTRGNVAGGDGDGDDDDDGIARVEDMSNFYECLIACCIQDTTITRDGFKLFANLDTISNEYIIRDNAMYSYDAFDSLIKTRVDFDQDGNPTFDFDFDQFYRFQIETLPNADADADRWKVDDTYGDVNYEPRIAFALKYDHFVNKLIHEENLAYGEATTPTRWVLQNYVDSLFPVIPNPPPPPDQPDHPPPVRNVSEGEIFKRGNLLLRFLHLAADEIAEGLILDNMLQSRKLIFGLYDDIPPPRSVFPQQVVAQETWIIDTGFHSWMLRNFRSIGIESRDQVPTFKPSTECGGRQDSIHRTPIDPAMALDIKITVPRGVLIKCYQVDTIIDYLRSNEVSLDQLTDLSTTATIQQEDKQNIANFIIMMYRLTPIVQRTLGNFFTPQIQGLYGLYAQYRIAIQPPPRPQPRPQPRPRQQQQQQQPPQPVEANDGSMVAGSKRKTIKYKTKYKNKSKNHKRINKHRITRHKKTKARKSTRKHRH